MPTSGLLYGALREEFSLIGFCLRSVIVKEMKDNRIKKEQIVEEWKEMVDFVQHYLLLDFIEDTMERGTIVAGVAIF